MGAHLSQEESTIHTQTLVHTLHTQCHAEVEEMADYPLCAWECVCSEAMQGHSMKRRLQLSLSIGAVTEDVCTCVGFACQQAGVMGPLASEQNDM